MVAAVSSAKVLATTMHLRTGPAVRLVPRPGDPAGGWPMSCCVAGDVSLVVLSGGDATGAIPSLLHVAAEEIEAVRPNSQLLAACLVVPAEDAHRHDEDALGVDPACLWLGPRTTLEVESRDLVVDPLGALEGEEVQGVLGPVVGLLPRCKKVVSGPRAVGRDRGRQHVVRFLGKATQDDDGMPCRFFVQVSLAVTFEQGEPVGWRVLSRRQEEGNVSFPPIRQWPSVSSTVGK